jgi:hypothetical protein
MTDVQAIADRFKMGAAHGEVDVGACAYVS